MQVVTLAGQISGPVQDHVELFGLGENPPTSKFITDRVLEICAPSGL